MLYTVFMLMILRILWRFLKSCIRILLIGWAPKQPPDFAERLRKVELMADATRKRVYHEEKVAEVALEPLVTVPQPDAVPYTGGPVHSDGSPVRHGDSPH